MVELSAEDTKLITLARATRLRVSARQGAAIRDDNGRTYAAASLDLVSLEISALGVCVAMAHASGARSLEAAVLLSDDSEISLADRAILTEFGGPGVSLMLATPAGVVTEVSTTLGN